MFKFSFDLDFSSALRTSLIIFAVLIIFFVALGIAFSVMDPEKDEIPTKGLKFYAVVLVDTVNNFVQNNLGASSKKIYAPYIIGVGSYLFFANISAMFGLTPPMSNIGLALSMSLLAFIILQFTGFKYQGLKNRLKGFAGPVPAISFLIFPISLFGEFTTPFSMGMRLFGNIFSGVILAGIATAALSMLGEVLGGAISIIATATIFHTIFDFAFGLIQMYVYIMLTTMLVKQNQE